MYADINLLDRHGRFFSDEERQALLSSYGSCSTSEFKKLSQLDKQYAIEDAIYSLSDAVNSSGIRSEVQEDLGIRLFGDEDEVADAYGRFLKPLTGLSFDEAADLKA